MLYNTKLLRAHFSSNGLLYNPNILLSVTSTEMEKVFRWAGRRRRRRRNWSPWQSQNRTDNWAVLSV